jgi:hypothetical protein
LLQRVLDFWLYHAVPCCTMLYHAVYGHLEQRMQARQGCKSALCLTKTVTNASCSGMPAFSVEASFL